MCQKDVMCPICPCATLLMCQKDVKLSKRCQIVKKMSKSQTHRLWRRFIKKINWHNEVHTYWCQFWCHIWWSPKTLKNVHRKCFGTILVTFTFDLPPITASCRLYLTCPLFTYPSLLCDAKNVFASLLWHLTAYLNTSWKYICKPIECSECGS